MTNDWPACSKCKVGRYAIYAPTLAESPDEVCRGREIVMQLKAGQHVLRAGDIPSHIYTIHAGWAFRYILLSDGRRQILEFLLPGDSIPLVGIWSFGEPITFHVRALSDITLCAFPATAIRAIVFSKSGERLGTFSNAIHRHLGAMDQRLADLGRRRASGRLARLILEMNNKLFDRGLAERDVFECQIRREHLADALGLTSTHVNRTIAEMERAEVLRIEDRQVRILNRDALEKLANE